MPAVYIALEREDAAIDAYVDGYALSREDEALTQIALELSVTPLSDFFSINPDEAADIIGACDEDLSAMHLEEEQWHEASAGLASVRALRDHLTRNPTAVQNPTEVRADLDDFERVLRLAEQHGIRWHLAIDI